MFSLIYIFNTFEYLGVHIWVDKVYFNNRKGSNSHFSHLENHCHYDMQHHWRCPSTSLIVEACDNILQLGDHVTYFVLQEIDSTQIE